MHTVRRSLVSRLEGILAWAIGGAALLTLVLVISDEAVSRKAAMLSQNAAWL